MRRYGIYHKCGMAEAKQGAAGQWRRAALLLAHSNFQTLRQPIAIYNLFISINIDKVSGLSNSITIEYNFF